MSWNHARPPATTRGYGREHREERARRLAYITAEHLCGYCGERLGPEYDGTRDRRGRLQSRWHLPHNRTRTGYLPGMWHAACNRTEGAIAARDRQDASPLEW